MFWDGMYILHGVTGKRNVSKRVGEGGVCVRGGWGCTVRLDSG